MRREHNRHKLLTRRTVLLGGGQLLLAAGLVGRMYQLQILQADRYAVLSDKNRVSLRLIPPSRGRILDRYGSLIAENIFNYQVILVPEQTPDIAKTLDLLGQILSFSNRERQHILGDIRRKRDFVPVVLKENLTWQEVARIEVNAQDLPGISIDVGQSRYYPSGKAHCHVVGYVAAVSRDDYEEGPLFELPGFRVGKSGIEKQYDPELRGEAGTRQIEVNALGRVIRELNRDESHPGQDMFLTIDDQLQNFVYERVRALNAAAVVMDVNDGQVLALVSTPGFDPNAFNKGLDVQSWSDLESDSRAPLTNKVISGQYAPGSTFKMIVALAALESGIIDPDLRFSCDGFLHLGDSKFHCWRKEGHGAVDMEGALRESCDVYFYKLSQKLDIEAIADMARRFGFGESLGIDLPSEQSGLVPSPEWKQAVIGHPWQKGETLLASIGQGYILATPLQLAVMTSRLVNGGRATVPFLAFDPGTNGARSSVDDLESLGVSQSSLDVMIRAMAAVVNEPSGTAFSSRIHRSDYMMGGKTGTSQVRRISERERRHGVIKNENLPWIKRDHALFVGYAPLDKPRYACAVIVEHGGSGAKVAAPIARDILTEAQKRMVAHPAFEGAHGPHSHAG